MAQTHLELDRRIAQYLSQHSLGVSCQKGCYFCCFALVVVGLAEAEYIRANLSPDLLAKAEQEGVRRIERIAKAKSQPDFATHYFLEANPCPFLSLENACTVHPHRPLACRGVLTNLDAHYCAPGAVLELEGVEKSSYEAQLRPYHGPEHYLKTPWQASERLANKLWQAEQQSRGFTVIGEMSSLIYLLGQESFAGVLEEGQAAAQKYLRQKKLLGGDWGFWIGGF